MAYPVRIEGARATFERWSCERHTTAFAGLCADAEVMRFLGGPQSAVAAEELSRTIADHWATFGFGLWAVVDPRDAACCGFAGAAKPGPGWGPQVEREVEIGWRLARAAWGRGLASEGGRLAIDAVATHLDIDRVISIIDPGNDRSLAVARRLGLRRGWRTRNSRLGTAVDVYTRQLSASELAGERT